MASSGEGENANSMARILKVVSTLRPSINASIDCFSKKASNILRSYEKMVLEDPEKLAKIESALTMISFVLPGNFRSSDVISELVYFATKMMALLHDLIYRKKIAETHTFMWTNKTYFQAVLTVIEYTESFLEIGATRLWGDPGKWLVIFALQILKAALKTVLLFFFNSGMQHSPSLLFVREKVKRQKSNEVTKETENDTLDMAWQEASSTYEKCDVWSGTRSGRVVRSLKSVPPKGFRDWKLPNRQHNVEEQGVDYFRSNENLTNKEKFAELAYILRPLGQLLTMFVYGEKSWKPWLLSLAVDVTSLYQLESKGKLQKYERDEILRRKASLLIYLLRSPFYDNYSKSKLLSLLDGIAKWVPGLRLVSVPLKEYLPVWQKMYSHNWST